MCLYVMAEKYHVSSCIISPHFSQSMINEVNRGFVYLRVCSEVRTAPKKGKNSGALWRGDGILRRGERVKNSGQKRLNSLSHYV